MTSVSPANASPAGLRERKKQKTRKAIADAAKALFEARGFDNVTVAEIAAAVDIAPKTLFTYFATKEDLLFDDEDEFKEMILAGIRGRSSNQSILDAVRQQIEALVSARQAPVLIANLDALRRSLGDNPSLHARLRLMWDRYETAIADALAKDTGSEPNDPLPRMVAVQIVALYRLLTSDAVGGYLESRAPGTRPAAVRQWFASALGVLEQGIGSYGRRDQKT
jgi:AcrR family transcriptional regulator